MNEKTNSKKRDLDKKSKTRKEKINNLVGVDLCSCFPMFAGKCVGICRSIHTQGKIVNCFCLYHVEDTDEYIALNKKGKKSKRREIDDFSDKDKRRERLKFKNENKKYE